LGLGVYTGIEQGKILIETTCSNQFRNGFIERNAPQKIIIKPYLKPYEHSKFSEGMDNSFCNIASWRIIKLISEGKLLSQYTFLYLPKSMKVRLAISEIDTMLEIFKKR